MNWFERHLNWTAGLFGHLLVFFLFFSIIGPFGYAFFQVQQFVERIVSFRSPDYPFYSNFIYTIFILLALTCYVGVNIWYLKMKQHSYKYLWWFSLTLIPLCALLILKYIHITLPFAGTWIEFALWGILYIPAIQFIIVAIILLRLKNNKSITDHPTQ